MSEKDAKNNINWNWIDCTFRRCENKIVKNVAKLPKILKTMIGMGK